MRTSEEILRDARQDILNPKQVGTVPFWLEYTKIEVLIDIRDQILDTKCMLTYLLDDDVKQALIKAGLLK